MGILRFLGRVIRLLTGMTDTAVSVLEQGQDALKAKTEAVSKQSLATTRVSAKSDADGIAQTALADRQAARKALLKTLKGVSDREDVEDVLSAMVISGCYTAADKRKLLQAWDSFHAEGNTPSKPAPQQAKPQSKSDSQEGSVLDEAAASDETEEGETRIE